MKPTELVKNCKKPENNANQSDQTFKHGVHLVLGDICKTSYHRILLFPLFEAAAIYVFNRKYKYKLKIDTMLV